MDPYTKIIGGRWVDPDEAPERPARQRPAAGAPRSKPPVRKQSYESNVDVQRWLHTQGLDEEASPRPPFAPSLLAGRRDGDWIISSLAHFYDKELISDVLQEVKSGKEATVFVCTAEPSSGAELLAAKIYRPRMFRSLSNDAVYRAGRSLVDETGQAVRGSRRRVPGGARGRALQVESWIAFEYESQQIAYDAGVTTPRPYAQAGNGVLMAYLGDGAGPAPRLCDVTPEPAEARAFLAAIVDDVRRCLGAHRVHGDLSGYNILVWAGRPWLIDFAQAVDPRQGDGARALLERDLRRVVAALAPYGARADAGELSRQLWEEYIRG